MGHYRPVGSRFVDGISEDANMHLQISICVSSRFEFEETLIDGACYILSSKENKCDTMRHMYKHKSVAILDGRTKTFCPRSFGTCTDFLETCVGGKNKIAHLVDSGKPH